MAEITTKICGVAFESSFKKAVVFKDARYDEVAQKCLEAFSSYGLKPPQIVARRGDQIFNHDLSFSLFNGNGTFKISSEKLDINLRNAATNNDVEIIQDCIARIYEHVPLPEISSTVISADAHASFASAKMLDEYFLRYVDEARKIVSGGTIAYIQDENWQKEIRFTLEKSFVYPSSVFLMWKTMYSENKISRELLGKFNWHLRIL